ncbi:MAG: hypothetical protein IJA16_01405 [Clostridia bacterium]|nr:hypothetical protein [Clostridia bacterium]
MTKFSRKLLVLISIIVLMSSFSSVSVSAVKVGDVIGYAQPTDIIATINGYQLQSYNVNDYTYICVEDLRHYGFNVAFNMYDRTLDFSRDYDITSIDPQNTNPDFWYIGAVKNRTNILYTDIGTYANGEYIAGKNINGKTIINFDELGRFGEVSYDNDKREISLFIEDIGYNAIALLADILQEEKDTEYNEVWNDLFRAKGDVLMWISTSRSYLYADDRDYIISYIIPEDKQFVKELLEFYQSDGIPVSSIYCEYKNSDGTFITSFQID